MKKTEIEEIFDELREMLNFHLRNAENKEDFIERIVPDFNEIEEKYKEKAE